MDAAAAVVHRTVPCGTERRGRYMRGRTPSGIERGARGCQARQRWQTTDRRTAVATHSRRISEDRKIATGYGREQGGEVHGTEVESAGVALALGRTGWEVRMGEASEG
jgi:hypothetical protein